MRAKPAQDKLTRHTIQETREKAWSTAGSSAQHQAQGSTTGMAGKTHRKQKGGQGSIELREACVRSGPVVGVGGGPGVGAGPGVGEESDLEPEPRHREPSGLREP